MEALHFKFRVELLVLPAHRVGVAFRPEGPELIPFYANLVQLDTFTVLRRNALTSLVRLPYPAPTGCSRGAASSTRARARRVTRPRPRGERARAVILYIG